MNLLACQTKLCIALALNMTPGRAALVELINRCLNALLDPFVTLFEVHKLVYFMQEAGESLKLNYRKLNNNPRPYARILLSVPIRNTVCSKLSEPHNFFYFRQKHVF